MGSGAKRKVLSAKGGEGTTRTAQRAIPTRVGGKLYRFFTVEGHTFGEQMTPDDST
jgi:hypothetical protein